MHEDYFDYYTDNRRGKTNKKHKPGRYSKRARNHQEPSFQCAYCHFHVLTDPVLSGVRNRNHCPYCLWSRHLDQLEPGDRLAVCKSQMKPVGLTVKKTRQKYGSGKQGELMLIHECMECGKVSINRIAADDDPQAILQLIAGSREAGLSLAVQLAEKGIGVLADSDIDIVQKQLFGQAWAATA